jgi:hypothetical protein
MYQLRVIAGNPQWPVHLFGGVGGWGQSELYWDNCQYVFERVAKVCRYHRTNIVSGIIRNWFSCISISIKPFFFFLCSSNFAYFLIIDNNNNSISAHAYVWYAE